jgi:hypothetical protein
MDATEVGYYQDCLLDLYAWDFTFGSGMDPAAILNGIFQDKLGAFLCADTQ